jgi:hypothetical protein
MFQSRLQISGIDFHLLSWRRRRAAAQTITRVTTTSLETDGRNPDRSSSAARRLESQGEENHFGSIRSARVFRMI